MTHYKGHQAGNLSWAGIIKSWLGTDKSLDLLQWHL
jgi:hypothetical protein